MFRPLAALFLLAAGLAPGLCRADVATDHRAVVALYHGDGGRVVRASCPDGNPLYDRATCILAPRDVALVDVKSGLEAGVGADVSGLQTQVELYYTKIERIDGQKLQLESAGGVPKDQLDALNAKLAVAQAQVDQDAAQRHDLLDQIARVEAQLQSAPSSSLAQLDQSLHAQLDQLGMQIGTAEAQLAELRDQFIQAHASTVSTDVFAGLQAERVAAVTGLDAAQAQLDASFVQVANLRQFETMLLADGQSYEILTTVPAFDALKPFAAKLFTVFQTLAIAALNDQRAALTAQLTDADARAATLRQAHAADLALRNGMVSESSTPVSQTLVIGVDASNANAPAGCTASTGDGHYTSTPTIELWDGVGKAADGDPDDGRIDQMIDSLTSATAASVNAWSTVSGCQNVMSGETPQAIGIWADFWVQRTYGSAGSRSCTTFIPSSVERADDACPALVKIAGTWSAYQAKGGHAWAHQALAAAAQAQQQADQIEASVATVRLQAATIDQTIQALTADSGGT